MGPPSSILTSSSDVVGVDGARRRLRLTDRERSVASPPFTATSWAVGGGNVTNSPRLHDVKTGKGIVCRVTVRCVVSIDGPGADAQVHALGLPLVWPHNKSGSVLEPARCP
jgi:hypothetical protein